MLHDFTYIKFKQSNQYMMLEVEREVSLGVGG
jgi:hypothetical protein